MESRTFIKSANELYQDIVKFAKSNLSYVEEQAQGEYLQRQLNNLFSGLQNPTLPSAYRLRDIALASNFFIDPKRLSWLAQFDTNRL